ncbi:RagB/SusD family nutrient uptake outer membrane protein [Dysgonomonas sp. BGC7]|uniref:RagB/SusD family nutrient uptake outer membrane protein n=1 Tax=Dysgonomonas sp. BGC7 TaxID=1658008 RepID=UPI0006806CEF|nr:RagB/SusD family nutrient uptake outer membrane protein [Dysgonomonas sp. BGC7]MBD8389119.1 RagB/SusD family nutrient uptake outer membrane protein [Dysgonomonas sp. BGC7]
MKKIIIYTIASIIIACSSASCLDLDVDQDSKVDMNSMWQTDEDCIAGVYGVYGQMRIALASNYAYWGDYRAGMFNSTLALGADISYMCTNTITSSNAGANWASLYKMINMANLVLKYTPSVEFKIADEKKWVLANAYFARALGYYYVARVWGDAPLVLDGYELESDPGLYPPKSPVSNIYDRVEEDIALAVSLMPATVPTGMPTTTTATITSLNMLKADFYMWMAKTQNMGSYGYTMAQEALDVVFKDTGLTLPSSYKDIFDATQKKANKEAIFVIRFAKDEYEGGFAKNYLFTDGTVNAGDKVLISNGTIAIGTEGGVAQRVTFTTAYENLLYENILDQRAQVSYRVEKSPTKTYRWVNKYIGEWISGSRYYSSDIIIYRLADAIMFQAELYNATGYQDKAIDEVNKIAKRAYGQDDFYPHGLIPEDVDEIIIEERMKEFAAEGKLWWDFIRMDVVFERVPSLAERENEKDVLLWPIHDDSKNKNPNLN